MIQYDYILQSKHRNASSQDATTSLYKVVTFGIERECHDDVFKRQTAFKYVRVHQPKQEKFTEYGFSSFTQYT